jgi:hypothetical protein
MLPPSSGWYPTTTLCGVTTQKTSSSIFTAIETSNLAGAICISGARTQTAVAVENGDCEGQLQPSLFRSAN